MIDKKKIGTYLKNLRKQKIRKDGKSFSIDDLTDEIYNYLDVDDSISSNAISEWENGVTIPSRKNLEILSVIYGKKIDEILDGEDYKKINFEEKYFICDDNWALKYDKSQNLYQIRNEQIMLITSKFKELLLTRIKRFLSHNEEAEFKFLFNNFYDISDYAKRYSNQYISDKYLRFSNAILELLLINKSISEEEKYWEIQKLYSEKSILSFSFYRDASDIKDIKIIKDRFKKLEKWQKDMLLAMFQNIEPHNPEPHKYGSKYYKIYEEKNGYYDHDKMIKDEIRELIKCGACLNKSFFNIKRKYIEKNRIIDRLEKLYDLCLRPIEIHIQTNGELKTYKIENNRKNRFLNNYYPLLSNLLQKDEFINNSSSDIEKIYDCFINMDEISEEIYFSIAKKAMINTEQEKKYWIADVENYSHITKILEDFKEKEKSIEEGLKEIKLLEKKLANGEKEYSIMKEEVIGGHDESSIREYIVLWKSELNYQEFKDSRDKETTKKLLEEIDNISLEEIKSKYFMMEVCEDE